MAHGGAVPRAKKSSLLAGLAEFRRDLGLQLGCYACVRAPLKIVSLIQRHA
jgi:hypothetical protein